MCHPEPFDKLMINSVKGLRRFAAGFSPALAPGDLPSKSSVAPPKRVAQNDIVFLMLGTLVAIIVTRLWKNSPRNSSGFRER
jgi:hypothetical protein